MSRNAGLLLLLLTYGMFTGHSHALTGLNVRSATPSQFRFAVSIAKRVQNVSDIEQLHFCTGALISRRSVLTAAHCVIDKNTRDVQVIAGSNDLKKGHRYFPESWIMYDEWKYGEKKEPLINDIAIIILGGDEIHNHNISTAEVLPINPIDQFSLRITIAGWGKIQHGRAPIYLRRASTMVINNEECSRRGTIVRGLPFTVPPNYFCSAAIPWVLTTCGDDGAPIVNRNRQIIGINIGTCPVGHGIIPALSNQQLHEIQVNTHLRLPNYKHFINRHKL